MTDATNAAGDASVVASGPSAGELLKRAREAQGMHIAALAVAVKVQQRKLEALEADRLDELPDITFARALAQTVCRHLRTDPKPVLDRMPQSGYGQRLEAVAQGLNEPFRAQSLLAPLAHGDWGSFARPSVMATGMLVVGALAVYFWPGTSPMGSGGASDGAPLAVVESSASQVGVGGAPGAGPAGEVPAVAAPSPSASPVVDTVFSAPRPSSEAASAATPVAGGTEPAGSVVVRAAEASWMEIRDASGQVLLSRMVAAGEAVGLEGQAPFKVKIGNASAVQVSFKGQPVDLAPWVKENVARFTLK